MTENQEISNDMNKTCSIKILNTSRNPLPAFQTDGASGMDLYADLETSMRLEPHKVYAIPTGIYIELPKGFEAQVRARSGLALKYGITLVNGIGTIDSDYRGEIKVIVMNLLDEDFVVHPGDRIAQLVIAEVVIPKWFEVSEMSDLTETLRGEGGFGHSGS